MSSVHLLKPVSLPWIQKYSTAKFDLFQLALALLKTKADFIQVFSRASEICKCLYLEHAYLYVGPTDGHCRAYVRTIAT